ncbi:hypothetical protein MO328_14605 [Xanthomonas translucens]|uniref:hypothetical protein n=1 Tax=Xanthomonas campestris pv. translucens TaxID=343 RepID=UPI0027149D23|nr:hypothetical protein [Xanthomonas translucens]WLA07624.1 hypothetical protein MO328_14605 [Xanthomonas translucens]
MPVGSNSERSGFLGFLNRNGGISPARLQSSTGTASRENGSPSADTVLLPMKISSPSNCGPIGRASSGAHTPSGIWMSSPPVPAVARLTPLTVTVAPRNERIGRRYRLRAFEAFDDEGVRIQRGGDPDQAPILVQT